MLRIRVKAGTQPNPFNRIGADGKWIKFTSEWQEFPDELIGPNVWLCQGEQLEIEKVCDPPEVVTESPIIEPATPPTKRHARKAQSD